MNALTQRVFDVVKAHVLDVLTDIDPVEVTPETSIVALGGNSLDRAEVAMLSMETLGLKLPRTAVVGVACLGELAQVLSRHLEVGAPGLGNVTR